MGNILSLFLWRPSRKAQHPLVLLITGASAGMGKEMAMTMIQRGHIVYGGARRVAKMQDLQSAGGHALELDVSNPEQVEVTVKRIMAEQGRIDVLVNNAGVSVVGSAEDVSLAKLRQVFDINFFGMVSLTQQVLPHMRLAGSGLIVNVSSVAGKAYKPFMSTYSSSKHAMEGWSDCLRTELEPFNVGVSIFQPGFVATDIFRTREKLTPADSPYKAMVDVSDQEYEKFWPRAAPPSVVAAALIHACESGQPKRRYVMGHMATPFLLARNWLGDGFVDFTMRRVLRRAKL